MRDPRFVFFAVTDDNPHGCLNVPVTDYRSIATDKDIFPRAAVAYIVAPLPRKVGGEIKLVNYHGFACDQDRGNGIRAAGRCDIYVGVGDEAGQLAGRTMQEGKLYYIFLKPGQSAPAVPAAGSNSYPPPPAAAVPPPSAGTPLPSGDVPPAGAFRRRSRRRNRSDHNFRFEI